MTQHGFKDSIAEIYEIDQARRKQLAALLLPIADGQKRLGMDSEAEDAQKLENLVANETFKILVIGEFNVGKSTFINALIGTQVLPDKAVPATAFINVLKYGDEKKARLHYTNEEKKPKDILVEELPKYVLIKSTGTEKDAQSEIRNSIFSHAEIWWPLELLRDNRVEIIDSPGLNENKAREDITMDYLKKVDAVLFIMSAVRFGPAQTEMDSIKALESAEHRDLFFVVNQWDMLRPRQQEEVRTKALNTLPELTGRKKDIYFVSALDALEGRIGKDAELEQKSGFKDFEAELHQFLAQERGKIKMLRSARELRRIIQSSAKAVPEKIALLKMPIEELDKRYENTSQQLKKLTDDKKEMLDFMKRQRTQIVSLTESRVKEFFYKVEANVAGWAEEFDLQTSFSFDIKSQVNTAIAVLGEHLKQQLEKEFGEWAQVELTPFIEERVGSLRKDLDRLAARFEERLQEAHFTLSGIEFNQGDIADGFGPSSALERLLAAAGGWFIGGLGSGAIGAVFGWREMLKGLLPNLGAIIAAILLGLPVLPIAILAGLIHGAYAFSRISDGIKEKVVEKFKEGLMQSRDEQAQKVADNIDDQLLQLQEALRAGTEIQIAKLKETANTARSDRKKEQGGLDAKLAEVQAFKVTLEKTEQELETFITSIIENKGHHAVKPD